MTRDELVARLRVFFENDTYYASTDFNASVQDGYDEAAALSGCIVRGAVVSFVAELTYYDMRTLLPDLIGVIAVFNRTTKLWMYPNSTDAWDQGCNDWETCIGTPEEFAVVNFRYMAINKKPGAVSYGDMYVFYVASAPTLGPTTTILIDDALVDTLEKYAQMDLNEQMQEWQKAGRVFSEYQACLKDLSVWAKSQRDVGRVPSLK